VGWGEGYGTEKGTGSKSDYGLFRSPGHDLGLTAGVTGRQRLLRLTPPRHSKLSKPYFDLRSLFFRICREIDICFHLGQRMLYCKLVRSGFSGSTCPRNHHQIRSVFKVKGYIGCSIYCHHMVKNTILQYLHTSYTDNIFLKI
jgi:hypothetical protein